MNEPGDPGGQNPQPTAVAGEAHAIWGGALAAVLALAVGLVAFQGRRPPLAGDGSVALFAAITAGTAAGLGFVGGYLRSLRGTHAWLSARPLARQVLDGGALAVVHGSIAVMSALVVFGLLQDSFFGLTVDTYAGAGMLAASAAIAAYLSYGSGARIGAEALSVLLAVFLASGMLVSMLSAENPVWWHSMFSELGTGKAGPTSFWTFNTTMTTSGIVLTMLASFITRDLTRWAGLREAREAATGRRPRRLLRPRVWVVRWSLLGIGLCMVGIGLVPVNIADPVHTFFVRVLTLLLLVLLPGIPLWAPGYPAAFYFFSYAATGLLAGAAYLWFPLRYYNLTALELAAAGIVFGWLVVFIRTTSAVVAEPR